MTHAEPIYSLRHAFEARPIVSCFGFEGLLATVPTLEPGLYMIRDRLGCDDGIAERHENGDWLVEMKSGIKAGPGCIIV